MDYNSAQVINFPSLEDYQVISFDVFDTSVFRMVFEPRDVFLIMEEELVTKYAQTFLGFSDLRFKAELETVSKVWKLDRSAEVNLDDIYQTLFFLNPAFQPYAQELKEIEIRTEESVIVPSYQVLHYFNKARQIQKKVIFVSDTYLPQKHLAKILENSGYQGYHKLFVSCEIGTNKASGKLFDRVIDEMNVDPQKILHIGDNPYTDIKQAASRNMNVYQLPYPASLLDSTRYHQPKYKRYHFRETANESLFRGLQKNYLMNGSPTTTPQNSSSYDIGYQILGPICYGFIRWIIQHAEEKKIKNLYFIAREGWFLKKVFDEIKLVQKTAIVSHYLYASRMALFYPFVSTPIGDYLCSFLISKKPRQLIDYLEKLGLEVSENRLKEVGFTSQNDWINPNENKQDKERLKALFNAETEQIKNLALEEKANYLEYLQEIGMLSIDQIGLVDSGWFGNGQRKLQQFMELANPNANLFGFYLALHTKAKKKFNEKSLGYGYLYHFDHENHDMDSFLEIARIIEVLLSAPAESLRKMAKKDGVIYPVFMKTNNTPSLHPTIAEIHEGSLAFIRDFLRVPTQNIPTIPRELTANLLQRFIESPTKEEAFNIGILPYDNNVLAAENEPRFAFPQITLKDIVKNPLSLHQEFTTTFWKSAYYENHRSPVLKFILQYTQRYFLIKNNFFNRVYHLVHRAYRKIKY
jgi:predicted HAD superfamily hydrolase